MPFCIVQIFGEFYDMIADSVFVSVTLGKRLPVEPEIGTAWDQVEGDPPRLRHFDLGPKLRGLRPMFGRRVSPLSGVWF